MTHDLVERMVGHRTRLAQQAPERWHDGEDELLARYVAGSEALDRTAARLWAAIPRGWLVVALASFVPALAGHDSRARVAARDRHRRNPPRVPRAPQVADGALERGGRRRRMGEGAPLFGAATLDGPATPEPVTLSEAGATRLEATGISYRYGSRGEPSLRDCSLMVEEGERVLFLGRSGAGKSTLGVHALRAARSRCGSRHDWRPRSQNARVARLPAARRRGAAVPRQLPASARRSRSTCSWAAHGRASHDELALAEEVCRDLGLGPLLDPDAIRPPNAGRGDRMAALARRAEPHLSRARAAPEAATSSCSTRASARSIRRPSNARWRGAPRARCRHRHRASVTDARLRAMAERLLGADGADSWPNKASGLARTISEAAPPAAVEARAAERGRPPVSLPAVGGAHDEDVRGGRGVLPRCSGRLRLRASFRARRKCEAHY